MTSPSAQAASGGGCHSYSDGVSRAKYVDIKTCISAPKRGTGRPDAYITLRSGHPACKIVIQAVRTGNQKVMSKKVHNCPSGAIREKRYTAPDFYDSRHETGEAYATFTQIMWTADQEGTPPYRSPWLKLP
ncbi:hypothetical protein NLX86_27810 [Streptomyces sp. A3M-1-3]|uniref:hypothetical protein n=1 Tax=Streptomyces sp. A3M-1-3 TaxID=2962044 RepID=UPI0020B806F1|nr:hypothetical protein [Streptomyces sp. A3M-1-3]MCP3821761.1 hypothetical protein [Streptomyces sp. A3M-1-3]